jgi:hypothetical protein
MPTHINNQTITSNASDPPISYLVSYVATRDKKQVTYEFTIETSIIPYGAFGNGYGLKCEITVGGVKGSVTLKGTDEKWNNTSNASSKVFSTKTLSITCESDQSNEEQTAKFVVTRPDGLGEAGKIDTSDYYVISPDLPRNVSVKQNGKWVECDPFVKQNGNWVECEFNVL